VYPYDVAPAGQFGGVGGVVVGVFRQTNCALPRGLILLSKTVQVLSETIFTSTAWAPTGNAIAAKAVRTNSFAKVSEVMVSPLNASREFLERLLERSPI
jgi:hypothetical protein